MDQDELQSFIDQTNTRLHMLETNPPLAYHTHTGYDMNKVNWADLFQRKMWQLWTIPGTSAATAANFSTIFIAPAVMNITSFKEVHATAGTDGSAVTLQLEKLTSTAAPGAGTNVLATALSLKAAANTVQTGSFTTTLANASLAIGDRLALKLAGTPTSLANVTVLLELTF